ncbi:MAG: DUF1579 family protein [Phycisphaerales bacterium JB063]
MKMMSLLVGACLLVVGLWLPGVLHAQDADPAPPAVEADPMAVLQAYEGAWACSGEWAWGATMTGRNIYEPVFEGRHMRARTYVSDNGGPEYLRYETLFSYDKAQGQYVYTTIAYDGSVETGVMTLRDDGFHIEAEQPDGQGGTVKFRQFVARVAGDAYAWRVQMQNPAGEWVTMMDDVWERIEPADE